MKKQKDGNFRLFGYLIFQRPNGYYYIEVKRGTHKTLRTKDRNEAERIALKTIQAILDKKVIDTRRKNDPTIKEYLETYLDTRLDKSQKTLNNDRTAVNMFRMVVGENKRMRELTDADGLNFKKHYINKNVSKVTIHTYFKHLSGFFKFAINDKDLDFNRSPLPANVKKPKRLPKVIPAYDRKKILKHLQKTNLDLWRITTFALYTGMRRAEIHDLEWQHFTPKNDPKKPEIAGSIRVIGKGDKERNVPLLKQAAFAMGEEGKGRIFKQWHPDTYTHKFHDAAKDIGIITNFHRLRHSAATQMVEDGLSLKAIQQILGHTDISTTMIYTELVDQALENEITKLKFKA